MANGMWRTRSFFLCDSSEINRSTASPVFIFDKASLSIQTRFLYKYFQASKQTAGNRPRVLSLPYNALEPVSVAFLRV